MWGGFHAEKIVVKNYNITNNFNFADKERCLDNGEKSRFEMGWLMLVGFFLEVAAGMWLEEILKIIFGF